MAGLSQKSKWIRFHNCFVKFVEEVLESSPCQRASIAKVASPLVQSGFCEIVDPAFFDDGDLTTMGLDDFEKDLVR